MNSSHFWSDFLLLTDNFSPTVTELPAVGKNELFSEWFWYNWRFVRKKIRLHLTPKLISNESKHFFKTFRKKEIEENMGE